MSSKNKDREPRVRICQQRKSIDTEKWRSDGLKLIHPFIVFLFFFKLSHFVLPVFGQG